MREDIASAIRQRNLAGVLKLFFAGNPPEVRLGYRNETDLWDFKRDCPPLGRASENAWAHVAADVLAFHNNRGGLLFFGFTDDYRFTGATTRLDGKMVNDQLRRYLPDTIWVDYDREFIQNDQRYLGVALVPPRGPVPARFRQDAPPVPDQRHRRFEKGGSALREGDSTTVLSKQAAEDWIRSLSVTIVGQAFAVNEPMHRILAPDYAQFIRREQLCTEIQRSLADPRISVTSLIGVGGMGKTALATWAALQAYERKQFEFTVSITAKDRELTSTGIVGLEPGLTSFERLLDEIAEVLGVPDLKEAELSVKEAELRALLGSGKGLLYVDNLETVDDVRIIQFLDSLPVGTRAMVTSRRTKVRVAAMPVDVAAMEDKEIIGFVKSLISHEAFRHVAGLTDPEILRIGAAWDGIPLAIRWSLSKAQSPAEALATAGAAAQGGSHGDELLEFSFRRVFESLSEVERNVLRVLAVLQQPIPIEALCVGVGDSDTKVLDAVESLNADALVRQLFDSQRNDVAYTVLPITRSFVQKDLSRSANVQRRIMKSLSDWFEARDVRDPEQRAVVRELRQGGSSDDRALLDLAISAEQREDLNGAERFYKQALERSPRSWEAARLYAEFERHRRQNPLEALRLYRQAASNAPTRGPDRALIFREWGLLLRNSGEPDASKQAEEKLRIALAETPNDVIALRVLAGLLADRGAYGPLIQLIEPHIDSTDQRFCSAVLPLLLNAYDRTRDLVKAAVLRRKLAGEESAEQAT